MRFLREHDLSGVLADDMGLGKTVQTLAHLLAEKEADRLTQPTLIVVPTTLRQDAFVTPGERVSRQDQVVPGDFIKPLVPLRAMQTQYP